MCRAPVVLLTAALSVGQGSAPASGKPSWLDESGVTAGRQAAYSTGVRLARSRNGLKFNNFGGGVLFAGASAPDVIRLRNGDLLALVDYAADRGTPAGTVMMVTLSEDEGRSWSPLRRIELRASGSRQIDGRHGELLRMPGGRLRLFFVGESGGRTLIRSAVTRDGIAYRLDDNLGTRITDAVDLHPTAVWFERRLHLYAAALGDDQVGDKPRHDTARHWVAKKGHRLAKVEPARTPGASFVGSVVRLGRRLRAYVSSKDGIRSLRSRDGRAWKPEPGVRMADGWDPAVIRLKDGSFLMMYCSAIEDEYQSAPEVTADVGDAEPSDAVVAVGGSHDETGYFEQEPTASQAVPDDHPAADSGYDTLAADVDLQQVDEPASLDALVESGDAFAQADTDWQSREWIEQEQDGNLGVDSDGYAYAPQPLSPDGLRPESGAELGLDGNSVPAGDDSDDWNADQTAPYHESASAGSPASTGDEEWTAHSDEPDLTLLSSERVENAPDADGVPYEREGDGLAEESGHRRGGDERPTPAPADPGPAAGDTARPSNGLTQRDGNGSDGFDAPADAELAPQPEYDWSQHDESEFVPTPDFTTKIDYMGWYETHGLEQPEDNAFDVYGSFMPQYYDGPDEETSWPEFHDMFNDRDHEGPPGPWDPKEHPEWETANQETQELLEKFRVAATYQGYAAPPRTSPDGFGPSGDEGRLLISLMLPQLSPHRVLSRATLADAWRIGDDGEVDVERMLDAWRTALRTAGHLARGATLIEELVSIAERSLVEENARWALKHGVFSSTEEIEAALELFLKYDRHYRNPTLAIRGEHATAMELTQYVFMPEKPGDPPRLNQERAALLVSWGDLSDTQAQELLARLEAMGPKEIRADIDTLNTYYRELAKLIRIGYPGVRASDLGALLDKHVFNSPWAKLIVPDLRRVYKLRGRAETSRRVTQLIYAVHLFKTRTGDWPESLDELPDEHGTEMRIDPFTGVSLGYRLTDAGPLIYSASENGIDDGGIHSPGWDDEIENEAGSDDYVFWPPQQKPKRK